MSALFVKLLNMSAAGSVLILAVVVLRVALKKAPRWIICAMWALAAVRLVCPVSIASPLSVFRAAPSIVSESGEVEFFRSSGGSEKPLLAVDTVQIERPQGSARTIQEIPGTSLAVTQRSRDAYLPPLVQAYLLGLAVMLLYAGVSTWILRKKVSASLRQQDRIRVCDQVASPFILGILRPTVYLPSSLNEEEKRFVLAHERAHLRRLDHIWKPLGFLILCVHWFNPFCWLAYVLLCRDMELACDEKVIRELGRSERAAYSQTLLNFSAHRVLAACPVAFGETDVKKRIKAVLNYKKPAFWIVLSGVLCCVVLVLCLMTKPTDNVRNEPTPPAQDTSTPGSASVDPEILDQIYSRLSSYLSVSQGIDYSQIVPEASQMALFPCDEFPSEFVSRFYEDALPAWYVDVPVEAKALSPGGALTVYLDRDGRVIGNRFTELAPPLSESAAGPGPTAAVSPEVSCTAGPLGVAGCLQKYLDVLSRYRMALTDEIDGSLCAELGISGLARDFYGKNPLQKLGYSLYDLDSDGIPELIIGAVENDEFYGGILFDVYRLFPSADQWGPPVKIAESINRIRWYSLGDGLLLNEFSGGASYRKWSVWRMDRSETRPVFTDGIVWDASADSTSPWFSARLENEEVVSDHPLTEREAADWQARNVDPVIRLDFTPFDGPGSGGYPAPGMENGAYYDGMGSELILYHAEENAYCVPFGVYKVAYFDEAIGEYDGDAGVLHFTGKDVYGKSVSADVRKEDDHFVVTIADWDYEDCLPNGTELVFYRRE